nr:hypothetical protein [Tanacetum cinerariifolium]
MEEIKLRSKMKGRVKSYTKPSDEMILYTIKGKPSVLPWGQTSRLHSDVRGAYGCILGTSFRFVLVHGLVLCQHPHCTLCKGLSMWHALDICFELAGNKREAEL